jgi:hypothetical protein
MCNITRQLLSVGCLILAASGVCYASKEEPSGPEALVSRARMQQDIWAEGTPPMSMRAEIQFSDAKGVMTQGQYIFDWVSPSRWREEIRLANYDRLRVRDDKGYWQKSTLNYQPEIIFQLDLLLDSSNPLYSRRVIS